MTTSSYFKRLSPAPCSAWGAMWHSSNKMDGIREHLLRGNDFMPKLFKTRKLAREYIQQAYGYIAVRDDLRKEPHGWRLPKAVRLTLTLTPNDPN